MHPRLRQMLRRCGAATIVIIVVWVVTVVVLLIFRPMLDLTVFKTAFEVPLTTFMETPVTVERVLLKPGSWVLIELQGIRVEAAGREAGTELASAEWVTLDLAVIPLLDNKIRLRQVDLEGATVELRSHADGTGNWPIWTKFGYEIAELGKISVTDTEISHTDETSGRRHTMRIDRFRGDFRADAALAIELEGSIDQHPIGLESTGPTIRKIKAGETWHQEGRISLGGSELEFAGTVGWKTGSPIVDLAVKARSENVGELAKVFGADSPVDDPLQLDGRLLWSNQVATLSVEHGSIGDIEGQGDLRVDFNPPIPRIEGAVEIGQIKTAQWLADGDTPMSGSSESSWNLEPMVSVLRAVETRISLTIDELIAPGRRVDELEIELEIADGVLSAPYSFRLGESPVEGRLTMGGGDNGPRLELEIEGRDIDLAGVGSIAGTAGFVRVAAQSHGATIDTIVEALHLQTTIDDLSMTITEAEAGEIEIPITSIEATQEPGSGLRFSTRGDSNGEEIAVELNTGSVAQILDGGPQPIGLSVTGGGAVGNATGWMDLSRDGLAGQFRFSVDGEAVGDLHPWIDVSPDAEFPYGISGRIDADRGGSHLVVEHAVLGRSDLQADLRFGDRTAGLAVAGGIQSTTIDLDELLALVRADSDSNDSARITIFDSLVPTKTEIPDINLELLVDRVVFHDLDLAAFTASLRSHGGRLESAPFGLEWEEQPIEGALRVDLRGSVPEANIFAFTEHLDLRETAQRFDLGSLPRTTAKRMDMELELRGSTLDEIVRESYASFTIDELRTTLRDEDTDRTWEIVIHQMQADALYGEPIRASAEGRINEISIEMAVGFSLDDLANLVGAGTPVEIDLSSGETGLEISGLFVLPFDTENLDFHARLHGNRLDELGALLKVQLPSIGPYSIDGRLTTAERNIDLSDLDLVVGKSLFRGEIGYFEGQHRPVIAGRLASHRPRIEDFYPVDDDPAGTGAGETPARQGSGDSTEPVIDPETLRAIDVDLSLDVTGLEWGDRGPGSGASRLRLDDGHLIATLRWDQPQGGKIDARLDLRPDGEVLDAVLDADIDRMSYGPLQPLLTFEGAEGGLLSLDTRLHGRGRSFEEWLVSSDGHLDFTTHPEGSHAAILNLWGGQLIDIILPLFQAEKQRTKLNCTVGELEIVDGVITPERLIFDASRSRILGKGVIDLPRDTIDLKLSPRPKRRGLLSLATPIHIEGPLDDPEIWVDTGGIAVTALRVYSWFLTVWFELFKNPLPMDGADICVDPPAREMFAAVEPVPQS